MSGETRSQIPSSRPPHWHRAMRYLVFPLAEPMGTRRLPPWLVRRERGVTLSAVRPRLDGRIAHCLLTRENFARCMPERPRNASRVPHQRSGFRDLQPGEKSGIAVLTVPAFGSRSVSPSIQEMLDASAYIFCAIRSLGITFRLFSHFAKCLRPSWIQYVVRR